VRQGETVGAAGATGRATGPHLDWRVNLFDIRVDPMLVLPPMPVTPVR
jgi:murein DD-endopeptidase MepM/ murein hydrolase activator NlpD